MNKLALKTKELSSEIFEHLLANFPELLTEAMDSEGNLCRSVDFDLLRQLLHEQVVEGAQERYRLDWPGKRKALLDSNSPITSTLRPCFHDSRNFEETENLFIEGDNLDGLKLIRESYLGKVDMIYIDPPYNTGGDFIYKDRYTTAESEYLSMSGQKDETGSKLVANTQSNGRFHSDWLSMMYPRLRIARQLLADNGLIFISIDDNERANLEKICEEIFGRDCFIGCFVWKRRSGAMDAVTNLSEDHEYILVFSKAQATLKGVERTFEKYANPDNDPRGDWIADNLSAGKPGGDTYYPIKDPVTGAEFLPPRGRYWPYSRETMARKINEGRVIFPKSGTGTPMLKRFASEAVKPTIPVSSWIERPAAGGGQSTLYSPMNSSATKYLKDLFGDKIFSFPKPVELISALIDQATSKDALILDFFAGSGTTAQATFESNARDGGNRRFILMQLPEAIDETSEAFARGFRNIADISKERIRRAGDSVHSKECQSGWGGDIGFRVLKVESSNMKEIYYRPDEILQHDLLNFVSNVKEDRTPEDLLFQVLIDWGVDLSLPVAKQAIQGKDAFFVDGNALVACFDAEGGIDENFVKEVAKHQPLRVVFRDAGFMDSSIKINVEQIFKSLSPFTEVKCI